MGKWCTLDYRVGSPRGGQMAHQSSSEPVPGSPSPLGLPLWGWCDRHGQTCLYIMTMGMRQHPGSPMPCSCDGIIVPLLSTVSIRNDWSEIRGYCMVLTVFLCNVSLLAQQRPYVAQLCFRFTYDSHQVLSCIHVLSLYYDMLTLVDRCTSRVYGCIVTIMISWHW